MLVNAVLKFNDVIKKLKFPQCFEKCKLPVLINMAANVSSKTSRQRKLNFTAVESNLISELATTHLELLQGKHSPEVTNAKKQEMWKEITSKVNALGVCLRTETEVRNRWRNLTRGAKQKFTTVQKERTQTGGGPPPTQPSQAEENIINCMRDTASFRGVPGGQETLIEGPEGRPSSLVKKAKEMKGQIEEYLQNYQPLKSLPKVGDSLLNDYVDKTKGISEEERDELTSYLSLKYKDIFNLSVSSDIPSMMHNTISFIIHHSGHKDQLEHTLQSSVDVQSSAVNEEMEDVWRNRLDIHFNAISDSSVPAAAPVTVVHEIVQTRTDLNVRYTLNSKYTDI
ncbi:unnamed protein product [Mytilus edulis]|uniref:Myb/SANT-like DNA-binding domain-containing protein n=1 Tax=Mytilus edulis TaxID=6550 RepID=A0A8S3TJ19_MYTED|nr:unnamed protein product [Mytilus edulis]